MTGKIILAALALALASAARGAGVPHRKADPEPPRRSPVGDWAGDWAGTPFTATCSRGGGYHETYDGRPFAGRWLPVAGDPRGFVVDQMDVPGAAGEGPTRYRFRLSRDGKAAAAAGGWTIRMRRVK